MIKSKLMLTTLMMVTVILSSLIAVSYAQQDRLTPAQVGDLVKLESVRGKAVHRETESSEMMNASIVLTGEITEINRTRIMVKIIDGVIQTGENDYIVENGLARVLFRKFGWISVSGNATASDGSLFSFHLEGMLHIERPRLVLAGLEGLLSSEESHYGLRLMTRIQRIE
ncbi:hypothetical protein [[Eubacterium] cellulosolvens]